MKSRFHKQISSIQWLTGIRILPIYLLLASTFTEQGFAQEVVNAKPANLLNTYYKLKDAFISSNSAAAASSANEFVKAIDSTDSATLNDGTRNILLKDAKAIAQSQDIKLQREKFAALSDNMFELAKSVKISTEPVYQQYCPMKKASWLSRDKAIKNPYYGSAMLTCGNIKATL